MRLPTPVKCNGGSKYLHFLCLLVHNVAAQVLVTTTATSSVSPSFSVSGSQTNSISATVASSISPSANPFAQVQEYTPNNVLVSRIEVKVPNKGTIPTASGLLYNTYYTSRILCV